MAVSWFWFVVLVRGTGRAGTGRSVGDRAVSGRQDSNLRPPAPKAGALAKLSYAPDHYLPKANMGIVSFPPKREDQEQL